MSLVNRVLKGTLWAYASLFSSRLIVFLANAWLVRLLSQEEFGLRHMALIVISLFEMLQSLGVNEALIYESDEVEKATENVFLINLGLGALFSVITISFGLWIVPNMSTQLAACAGNELFYLLTWANPRNLAAQEPGF
jgi:O-antigen/teichoic acid export membrane protein